VPDPVRSGSLKPALDQPPECRDFVLAEVSGDATMRTMPDAAGLARSTVIVRIDPASRLQARSSVSPGTNDDPDGMTSRVKAWFRAA
jgi:hypothetical protein